jgi:hypothetical protein
MDKPLTDCFLRVIAIHPLDGHAWRSFSAVYDPSDPQSPEINWLRDVLPKALEASEISARIMTFGYDSERWLQGPPRHMDMPSNDLISSLQSDDYHRFAVSKLLGFLNNL